MTNRRVGAFVVVAAVAAVAASLVDSRSFFRAWLFAWTAWTGLATGALGVLLLWHVTGGAWGTVIRRPLEAAAATIPWLAAGFLPIAAGLRSIYPWATERPRDSTNAFREAWLSRAFFVARAVLYLVAWSAIAWTARRASREEDRTGSTVPATRMKRLAGPALLVFVVTAAFASMDWTMSLEPDWASSAYGIVEIAGQIMAALAFAILVVVALSDRPGLRGRLRPEHFHDLGNLLLAFVMLWAYVAFGQFLILWSGNLPHETPWLLRRTDGGWRCVAWILVAFQFGLPFLALLSRDVKRSAHRLAAVAALVVALHVVERCWVVEPAWGGGFAVQGWDASLFAAIGSAWLAGFRIALRSAPLLPRSFDEAPEGLAHG